MSCSTTMTELPPSTKLFNVGWMQTGRRFVENVKGSSALYSLQLGRELDPLGFAARQLGRRLSQLDVTEPDFPDDTEAALQADVVGEETECFVDGHTENVGDGLAGDLDL